MSNKWPLIKLGDFLSERQETPDPGKLLIDRIPIISKISFDTGKIELRDDSGTKTKMILIRPGDLVLSGINATKGAIAVYDKKNTYPIAATIHYSSYSVDEKRADVKFLWWLLRSHTFRELLLQYLPGGIKTELKASRFLPVPIPLPSLDEQRRIVARIEALAAKVEQAQRLRQRSAGEVEVIGKSKISEIFRALAQESGLQRLENLITQANYGTSTRCQYEREKNAVPILRIPNIIAGRVSLEV